MKTTELRLGNLVKNQKGVAESIQGIYTIPDHIEVLTETHVGLADDFTPIPLTEEWLERFGFERDEEYDEGGLVDYRLTLMKNSLEFVSFWNSEEITGVNQPQTGVDVEYVHQLQNLYFALTGQELTIKE